MSDPIRIPSCRPDEMCPVCTAPALPLYTHAEPLPCGCVIGGPACASMGCRAHHLARLLAAALAKLHPVRHIEPEFVIAPEVRLDALGDAGSRARAELLGQAVGLAATAAPSMEANPDDPIGMMQRVVAEVESIRVERDAAIMEREKARLLLASARGTIDDLRESLDRQEEEIATLTRERDEALANYRFMVERAADQKLDGYRALAQRAADAENRRDEALRDAAMRYDCHGGPGTTADPCEACVSCVMRRAEKAEKERDEARAASKRYVEMTDKHVDGLIERAERGEALLRALLREVLLENVWVSAPFLAKIREVLG